MPSPALRSPAAERALPQSWLGVERRHLAALQALAEHGSFRAAARTLGYSQSAMSQLVMQLERMLGVPLVERQPGAAVALTRQGDVLLSHATAILHSFAAAQADIAALSRPRLRVGILASLAPRLLTAVLDVSDAEIVEVADDGELAALVVGGAVEVAFGERPPVPGPFDVRRLGRDPHVLAVPAGWRVTDAPERSAAELLERLPLIARPASDRPAQQLRARGITPLWTARAVSDAAALALVRAGSGAAILTAGIVEPWDQLITTVPLDDLLPAGTICRYVHRDRRLPEGVEAIADAAVAALSAAHRGPRLLARPRSR